MHCPHLVMIWPTVMIQWGTKMTKVDKIVFGHLWLRGVAGPHRTLRVNFMMTSSNGNIFRVTGPLCGEFTGHRWIPTQRSMTRSFNFVICAWINGWVNTGEAGNLRRHRAHFDVTLMLALAQLCLMRSLQYRRHGWHRRHDILAAHFNLNFLATNHHICIQEPIFWILRTLLQN